MKRLIIPAETLAGWEAEDSAVRYLARLPSDIAMLVAVKTAKLLFDVWEAELERMRSRGDPRKVFIPSSEDRDWLAAAVEKHSKDERWRDLNYLNNYKCFADLHPDEAGHKSLGVARYITQRNRLFEAPPSSERDGRGEGDGR